MWIYQIRILIRFSYILIYISISIWLIGFIRFGDVFTTSHSIWNRHHYRREKTIKSRAYRPCVLVFVSVFILETQFLRAHNNATTPF